MKVFHMIAQSRVIGSILERSRERAKVRRAKLRSTSRVLLLYDHYLCANLHHEPRIMSTNPRRESLSLFDVLNPVSKPPSPTHNPIVHHLPEDAGAQDTAQTYDTTSTNERPAVAVKTEPLLHTELDDDDQELLALGATEVCHCHF